MHPDGNGLYLLVEESGSRSWILRTVIRGRRKDIGLGGLSTRLLPKHVTKPQRFVPVREPARMSWRNGA
jgi:hypothetical protein